MARLPDPHRFANALFIEVLKTKPNGPKSVPNVGDHWEKCKSSWKIREEIKAEGGPEKTLKVLGGLNGQISRGLNAIRAYARLRITTELLLPRIKRERHIDYDRTSIGWAVRLQQRVFESQNDRSDLVWLGLETRHPGQRRIEWEPSEKAEETARETFIAFVKRLDSYWEANYPSAAKAWGRRNEKKTKKKTKAC